MASNGAGVGKQWCRKWPWWLKWQAVVQGIAVVQGVASSGVGNGKQWCSKCQPVVQGMGKHGRGVCLFLVCIPRDHRP
eukprot:scaffold61345_cov23-Tisochrysis_lutea.AAC.3